MIRVALQVSVRASRVLAYVQPSLKLSLGQGDVVGGHVGLTIEAFSSERQENTNQQYHAAGAGLRRTQRRLLGARTLRAGRNGRHPVRKPAVVCCNVLLGG